MATTGPTKNLTAKQFLEHELNLLRNKPEQHAALRVAAKVISTFTELGNLQESFQAATGSKFRVLEPHARRLDARESEILDLKGNPYPTLSIGLAAIAREYEIRLISERREQVSTLFREATRTFRPFALDDQPSAGEGAAIDIDFATRPHLK